MNLLIATTLTTAIQEILHSPHYEKHTQKIDRLTADGSRVGCDLGSGFGCHDDPGPNWADGPGDLEWVLGHGDWLQHV